MSFRFLIFWAALIPFTVLRAATLTQVPMQGGMVMPMIHYDSASGNLSVMMPTNVPQLTPLLVSNPSDSFDPVNPWFNDLDPSARGYSFSRRYGFVMDNESDIPADDNKSIWLRKIDGTDGLSVFRYSASPAPGIWDPIFGTDGTSNALAWNLMMFHPAFTAMPGTNSLTAIFEAYLVDNTSGLEISGSATEPMVFTFTNLPDGRPSLGLETTFAIRWDPAMTNYSVEYTTDLTSADWSPVTNQPMLIDGQSTILMPVGEASGKCFRMRTSP